jgi:hypothetical protein
MASGSEVVLRGPAMVGLIALSQSGLEGFAIVGGVAVAARLGQAHRATTDVDTAIDEVAHPDGIAALLALPDAHADPTGPHRVRLGETNVEIIGLDRSTTTRSTASPSCRRSSPLPNLGARHGNATHTDSRSRDSH